MTSKCSRCNNDLDSCWLTYKGEEICSDCWAVMKNPPKPNCITPEELQYTKQGKGLP